MNAIIQLWLIFYTLRMRLNIFDKCISNPYIKMFQCSENFLITVATVSQEVLTGFMMLETENDQRFMPNLSTKEGFAVYNKPEVTGSKELRWSKTLKADAVCRNHDRCHQCVRMDFSERCDIHKGYKFEARQDSVTQKKVRFPRENFHFRRL